MNFDEFEMDIQLKPLSDYLSDNIGRHAIAMHLSLNFEKDEAEKSMQRFKKSLNFICLSSPIVQS